MTYRDRGGILVMGALVALAASGPVVQGQSPPVNASLVGQWSGYTGEYADVWGDGNFAYVGSFTLGDGMQARVHILNISDPANPTLASTYFLPSPNEFRSPQDVKVGDGFLFIGLESGGADLVEIVDVRNPSAPVHVTTLQLAGFNSCHDVFYDQGFLYVVDSATPRVIIYDLRTLNPDSPPPGPIATAKWVINDVGTVFVHDINVSNGRLYAAAWDSGLWVYDVSDVANTPPVFLGSVAGNNTHSMWPTDDGTFVVTGEERGNGGLTAFRITEGVGSITLTETDSLVLSNDAFSVHNMMFVGNRLYVAWYQAGLQVYDVNPVTGLFEFVASYDTSTFGNTGGFNGAWGVYPFLGADKVLVSDIEEGFFVINVQGPLVTFAFPDGLPDPIDPNGGTQLRVEIMPASATPDPQTVQLFSRSDGGLFTSTPMVDQAGVFVGSFPPAPCGSTVEYYISVQTTAGDTVTDPPGAPNDVHSALAIVGLVDVISLEFESAPGWTVSGNATDGPWERAVPILDCDRGNPQFDFDGSGACFLTDNSAAGFCNSDVDGGTTTLTSPAFDLTGMVDPHVSYARWFSNNTGASPNEDLFEVEVSDDDGATWQLLEVVGPGGPEVGGGWFVPLLRVADFAALTPTVRFRFNASDTGNGSVVEAALDAFKIVELQCTAANTPPVIQQSPLSQSVCEGDGVAFQVVASGTGPLSYQWRLDGVDLPNTNAPVLEILSASPGDQGDYTCLVTNAFGSDLSAPGTLTVITAASCDDGNACTLDSCAAATCTNTDVTPVGMCCDPVGGGLTAIDDGDACTQDVCQADGSVDHFPSFDPLTQCCDSSSGQVVLIDDANACTTDTCQADGSVSHVDNFDAGVDCCDPVDGVLQPIDDGNSCTDDLCDAQSGVVSHTLLAPVAAGSGGRAISMAFDQTCADDVALRITSLDFPCMLLYVDPSGGLTPAPVFQPPTTWGAVVLVDAAVIPESSYVVQAELPSGALSAGATAQTWNWGDLDNDGFSNLNDALLGVLAFQGDFSLVTFEAADIGPCTPDGVVNLADIQLVVLAFQSETYVDTGCALPCP
ncbi:MAG: immunoglobulin domain-containing protein [Phycisphaerae bacterium]